MARKPKTAAIDAALAKRGQRASALFDATVKNLPDLVRGAGPGALEALGDAYGVGKKYVQSRTPQQVAGDVAKGLGAVGDVTARYAMDRTQNPLKLLGDAYGVGEDIVTAVPQAVGDVARLSERAQALKATDPAAARRMQAGIAMAAMGVMPGVRTGKKVAKAVDEAEKLAAKYLPPAENAQRTQISGTTPTYVKAKALLDKYQLEGKTIDFGAGLGEGAKVLGADTYEPFPRIGFDPTYKSSSDIPGDTYHRLTNLNVLNVVPKDTRDTIVKDIGRVLAPGGKAIITTRGRDVMTAAGEVGPEAMSKITTRGTYQKGFTPEELHTYIRDTLGEGYDVDRVKLGPAGVVVTKQTPAAEKLAAKYADPESSRIADWQWRPQEDVKAELGLSEVPPHVVDYGRFMDEQASRATKGQMTPRDLLKAYGITRSSMQRSALSLPTAQKRGLDLEHLGLEKVRPEGAFSELLGTPEGQAYLDAAQKGQVNDKAINDMMAKFRPYGFQNALGDDLRWAASNLPQHNPQVSDMVAAAREGASNPEDWTRFVKDQIVGVDAAKAGFVGAMLGRGDLPTLDARQIILQTGKPTKKADKYLSRKKGEGSVEAVKRLTARMKDLNLALPPELEPYRQHLTHHTVWDKASDEMTTHADVMNALKGYAEGGLAEKYGVEGYAKGGKKKPTDIELAVQKLTRMKPGVERPQGLLPLPFPQKDGKDPWTMPQFAYDLAKAFVTPGVAAQGGSYDTGDVVNMAMNVTGGGLGASHVAGPTVRPGQHVLGMGVKPKAAPAIKGVVNPLQAVAMEFGRDVARRLEGLVPADAPLSDWRNAAQHVAGSDLPNNRPTAPRPYSVRPADVALDPRIESRKGELAKIQNLELNIAPRATSPAPEVSIFDFEGHPFVSSMSDLSAAGDDLISVNGVKFQVPFSRRGGQNYMFDNPGEVWAADKKPAEEHTELARRLQSKTGKDVLLLPWTMGPTSVHFSHQPRGIQYSYADAAMDGADRKALAAAIKTILPDWRGFEDPQSAEMFMGASGKARGALNKLLDKYRARGGLGLGEATYAATDLSQIGAPLTSLRNVGIIDPRFAASPASHYSYRYGVPGQGRGVLKEENLGALALQPGLMQRLGYKTPFDFPRGVQPGIPSPLRSMQMAPQFGVLDYDTLRFIQAMLADKK